MKKILFILYLFISLLAVGQEDKPIKTIKVIQSPLFYRAPIDSSLYLYGNDGRGGMWNRITTYKELGDTIKWFVPYDGAFKDLHMGAHTVKAMAFILDTTYIHTDLEKKGTLAWDESTQSVETHISSDLHLNNGEELWVPLCYNNSGVDILNGQPVYINSASGTDPTIRLASNKTYDESRLIGVATQNIPNGTKGRVTRFGYVNSIDLSSCVSGGNVYLGDKVLTHIRPNGGDFPVVIGKAIVCTTTGRLLVYPQSVEYTAEINKTDGWPSYLQGEQTNLAFSDLTRTISISPVSADFYFYQGGIKYIKTGIQTLQISDVEGIHLVYYDLGVIQELINPSVSQVLDVIRNKVTVSVIYWDATNKTAIYVSNERHTFNFPSWVHAYAHNSFGTQYSSGLAITNVTLGSGAVDADAQFGADSGSIADEDIITTTSAVASTTGIPIYYRLGSGMGVWRRTYRAGYAFLNDGTTGLAMYNLYSGGSWSITSMTNNYYRLIHVFATNDISSVNGVIAMSGVGQYASAATAEASVNAEIANIYNSNLPFAEVKHIASLILHTKTGLGNSVNARYVAWSDGSGWKDFRRSSVVGSAGGGSGAGSFLGLSDTPDSYAGQASKLIGTTSLENGVEFKPVTVDVITGVMNIPATATYNKGGVPIISQILDGSTTTLTASQKAIKDYADTKEPLLTKGNLTESISGMQFSAVRQVIGGATDLSLTPGYIIPLTASVTAYDAHIVNTSNPHNVTKAQVGLGNVTNDAQVKRTEMGANNGVATLDAGGKVPYAQLPASLMIYKGVWSPLTNTPTLTDGVGTAGWVYKANLSGTTDFGHGPISFYAGDWVLYNGTTWERSVGTDNVVSVNGQQGVVSLNTSHIPENTNLYYTDARARAALSLTTTGNSGASTYNNSTGVLNVPEYTLAGLGGAPASGSGSYIWNGISQQTANFNISGEGEAYRINTNGDFNYHTSGKSTNYHGFITYTSQDNSTSINNPAWISGLHYNYQGDFSIWRFTTDHQFPDFRLTKNGEAIFTATIQSTTAKLTNLTDGYLPYHISDASGLSDSPLRITSSGTGIYHNSGFANASGYKLDYESNDPFLRLYRPTGGSPNSSIWQIRNYFDIGALVIGQVRKDIFTETLSDFSNLFTIHEYGNIGVGYTTGSEITNNKLAVNGSGYFNGTINSIGYLLNGNNLFSSLSSGYLPYWDGTKFLNSNILNGSEYSLIQKNVDFGYLNLYIENTANTGYASTKLVSRNAGLSATSEINYANGLFFKFLSGNNEPIVFTIGGIDRLTIGSTGLNSVNLSGAGTRLTTALSDGTLGTLANGTGYPQNDGSGNISWNFPEITSLRSTGSTLGQVATSNGAGGIEMKNPVLSVTTFVKEKSPTGIFNLAHSSVVYNNQLFIGERAANPKIVKFSNLDNLSVYSSTTITGSGFSGQGLEYGYYVSSISKVCFSVRNQTAGLDIIELNPADMTWTRHNFSTISGNFHVSATDGTYIYVANLSYIKKIRVSDWTEIASVGLPSNIQFPHAMEVNVARGEAYLTGSIADPIYMAKINTSDLSYTQIDLSAYISKATDDLCFYDDGTTNKVFIGGETFANTQQYCGVVVETTNGDALSQIHIKPSYGLFIDGVKVFSCSLDGYIQTFSALDPTNVSTFIIEGFSPNEVLPVSSSGRTFFTHWNTTASVMAEFYVPLPTPIQSGLTNPMTTTGDMIYSVGSTPTRLGIGSSNQVLTVIGGVPSWQNAAAGFTDPMTTRGDMIYRNSSNVTARLPLGTNGQLLGSNGSDVVWVNAPSGTSQWTTDTNGITYAGNIGVGVASAVGTRIYAEQNVNGAYTAKIRNTSSTGLGMFLETSGTTSSHPILLAQTTAINDVFRVNADGSIKMSLLPNVDQSYVLGYNPSTGAVTYLTKPSGSGGSGTVTSFSSGNLSPLFTTSVSNATTTPALSFSAVSQAANTGYFAPNGTSGVPGFRKAVIADISATGTPSASTYLRGDGSWSTPAGATNYWTYSAPNLYPNNSSDNVVIGLSSNPTSSKLYVYGDARINYVSGGSSAYAFSVSSDSPAVSSASFSSSSSLGSGITAQSTAGGIGGIFATENSTTNTSLQVARIMRTTSGTPANGIGGHISFYTNNSGGSANISEYGKFGIISTDITSSSHSGKFNWSLAKGGTVRTAMELDEIGTSTIGAVLKLAPSDAAPSSPTLGMIYVSTDTHIYFYNGTTWKQLDN